MDQIHKPYNNPLRYLAVKCAFAILMLTMVAKLSYLQLAKGSEYRRKIERQSLRKIWIPALRGKIYDRNMYPLALNRPSFDIDINANNLHARSKTNAINYLSALLEEPKSNLWSNMNPRLRLSFETARVASDIDFERMTRVSERLYELPGVDVAVNPIRYYPEGMSASHIIGYTGKVANNDPKYLSGFYYINDVVGKNGIERAFEDKLHGYNGKKYVEVDRLSHFNELIDEQPPINGNDIILSIDLNLQRALEKAFTNKTGAAVAIDPQTGQVLALVSAPNYDPNFFIGRVTSKEYIALRDDPDKPLFNRAIQGQYPLGSVFKIITALAGLETGVITSNTIYNDTGQYRIGKSKPWRNYHNSKNGRIGLLYALRVSCNTFFCSIATRIGIENLSATARAFGFGEKTGIELPHESSGLVPDKIWKKYVRKAGWNPGDTVNVSIGHGDLLVTPIQVARMVSAIGNGGILRSSKIVKAYTVGTNISPMTAKIKSKKIKIAPENIELVRQGMWEVVNTANGSGRRAKLEEIEAAGKTGSAMLGPKTTFGWYVTFAPYNNPSIALAIVVEKAQGGGTDAAPIAKKALEAYFNINTN